MTEPIDEVKNEYSSICKVKVVTERRSCKHCGSAEGMIVKDEEKDIITHLDICEACVLKKFSKAYCKYL